MNSITKYNLIFNIKSNIKYIPWSIYESEDIRANHVKSLDIQFNRNICEVSITSWTTN